MGTPRRNRAGYATVALAMGLTVLFLLPVAAQTAGRGSLSDGAASNTRNDPDPARAKTPKVSITTQDAVGEFGVALPLDVKLIRAPEVVVDRIKVLGLPPGATISDVTNTISPSNEDDDVDISGWDLSKLQITQRTEGNSNFVLAVAAIWIPAPGGHVEVTSSLLNVKFVRGGRDQGAASGGEPRSAERPAAQNREATASTQSVGTDTRPDALIPDMSARSVKNSAASDRPAAPTVTGKKPPSETKNTASQRSAVTPQIDPLVERAKGLIRLGDISGARLLLERAQARDAPNATFLLAQTWDPAMLRTWKVHGLRADPELAKSLYAKAADQKQQEEQRLAATGR